MMDDPNTIIAAAMHVEAPQDDKARQWVELVPGPEIRFNDGRPTLTMDDANKVILASDIERGLPIDFDHQSDHIGKSASDAPAAGWIVAMAARNGGIEALIEWTKLGRERLADRQYRYISPTIRYTKDNRLVSVQRAGLTNNPALTMKALAASEDRPTGNDPKDSAKPTAFWSDHPRHPVWHPRH